MKTFIQVAGIQNQKELELVQRAGVEYLGFPLRLDVHQPDLSEQEAAKLMRQIVEPHKAVLITYLNQADEVLDFMNFLGTSYVQLHGPISNREVEKLKKQKKSLFVIKSLVIRPDNHQELIENIAQYEEIVDAFITDTFDPRTGASGATGLTHDWSLSWRFVELSSKPVILAGGLRPENVEEAIRVVRPAGVDVHTGVEDSAGHKSYERVKAFCERALKAFSTL